MPSDLALAVGQSCTYPIGSVRRTAEDRVEIRSGPVTLHGMFKPTRRNHAPHWRFWSAGTVEGAELQYLANACKLAQELMGFRGRDIVLRSPGGRE